MSSYYSSRCEVKMAIQQHDRGQRPLETTHQTAISYKNGIILLGKRTPFYPCKGSVSILVFWFYFCYFPRFLFFCLMLMCSLRFQLRFYTRFFTFSVWCVNVVCFARVLVIFLLSLLTTICFAQVHFIFLIVKWL